MIEVESKIRVSDINTIRKKIKAIAHFIKIEKKIDDYYTLQPTKKYPTKNLRIRKKGSVYELNFKKRISYKHGVHAKNEHEFIVKDIKKFLDLINEFGFKRWLRKEKTTELYHISRNFNIELNNLKKLGWFLEIEYLCNKNEIAKARQSIVKVMKQLNIKKKDIIFEGYTKMLWDKK